RRSPAARAWARCKNCTASPGCSVYFGVMEGRPARRVVETSRRAPSGRYAIAEPIHRREIYEDLSGEREYQGSQLRFHREQTCRIWATGAKSMNRQWNRTQESELFASLLILLR